MIFSSRILQDSGEKTSSRPRKSSPRKSKATPSASKSSDDSVDTVAETKENIETVFESVECSKPTEFQEESSPMTQSQNDVAWQPQAQFEGEQVTDCGYDAQETLGYVEGEEYYEEESVNSVGENFTQNQNQIMLTLSYSLMNHVRQVARMEGVFPEDILVELIAEGVTRRAFEDAQRPAPSHLMTRTGYVAPDANGNVQQPQLSHHGMQGNQRGHQQGHNNNRRYNQNNNSNNNRGNHFGGRNRQQQFKNKPRNGK